MNVDNQDLAGLTPLMKQYMTIKQEHKDALVLFQVGDFYELFFEDAKTASAFLGITLTKRGQMLGEPIPLCGVPVHTVDHYIPKLIKGGFKVALCDQLEVATAGKMVARGVTQVLTPGTLVLPNLLDAKSNSYLLSFFPTTSGCGLLFSELLTLQMHATVLDRGAMRQLETELYRFLPDEILMTNHTSMQSYESFFKQRGFFTTQCQMAFDEALLLQEKAWVTQQFDAQTADRLLHEKSLLCATILWKKYIEKNQKNALAQFRSIHWYKPEQFLMLDGATQKNLDLVKNSFDGSRAHTVLSHLDQALTPMGSRTIKRWLLAPLVDRNQIQMRHEVIAQLLQAPHVFQALQDALRPCGDMQRIVGKIALDKAGLQDFVQLLALLQTIPSLKKLMQILDGPLLQSLEQGLADFSELATLLLRACNDDSTCDYVIKASFDQQLDHLRDVAQNSGQKILELECLEQQRTSIGSLKIRHNALYGYYIEVTHKHVPSVPDDYVEQQSLANHKRYSTQALQALQFEITQAQSLCEKREKELFAALKETVRTYVALLRQASLSVAQLDALIGLARVAHEHGYVCPQFTDGRDLVIKAGKHPIVATTLALPFIPNDTQLTAAQSLWIITGPNMGGKSTYLRQVALICLLAHMGSFVPAQAAQIPMLDRIFTRIGAGDHLAQGKSTFLVEMEETAQICLQATGKSLIILDEVGRGTNTYDGLALAQAIAEHLMILQARCLFATHYHELALLQDQYPSIASYYMDSQKTAQGIVFLHTLVRGVADGSFGIEVAKLAQLPPEIIDRAQQILGSICEKKMVPITQSVVCAQKIDTVSEKLIAAIRGSDVNSMTPLQAFSMLCRLKDMLE